jgi:predicted RNase H-like HicB family nuclease
MSWGSKTLSNKADTKYHSGRFKVKIQKHPVIIRLYREKGVIVAESVNCPGLATHAETLHEVVALMEELIPAWFNAASRNHFKLNIDPNRVFFENETEDHMALQYSNGASPNPV